MTASPLPPTVWIDQVSPTYPQVLIQHFGDDAPQRIAALGNLDLLQCSALAFLCSVKCPGKVILQTYDLARALREAGVTVIGGFHSPMERECLRILLRGEQPVIVCPARSLVGMRISREFVEPLQHRRLLFLSPFPDKLRRVTVQTALYRNHFLAALADKVFIPYAAPSSKTFEFCRVLVSWHKPLFTLVNEADVGLIELGAEALDDHSALSRLAGE